MVMFLKLFIVANHFFSNTTVLDQVAGCSHNQQYTDYTNTYGSSRGTSHTFAQPPVYGAWDKPERMVQRPESYYDGGTCVGTADTDGYQSAPSNSVVEKTEKNYDECDGDDEGDVGGYQSAPTKPMKKKKTIRPTKRPSPAGPMTRAKTINLKKKKAE
jgi:hypothetical protein